MALLDLTLTPQVAATYRTATVGFSYEANEGMNITGNAGMSRASGGIKGSPLSLSANWEF